MDAASGCDCDHQSARTAVVPEFAEVYPLPGTQVQSSTGDGDGYRTTDDGGLQVGRHIIVTLF